MRINQEFNNQLSDESNSAMETSRQNEYVNLSYDDQLILGLQMSRVARYQRSQILT